MDFRADKIRAEKILIVGGKGQVGQEVLRRVLAAGLPVMALDFPQLDITNRSQVFEAIAHSAPTLVINCAAYTAVDKAEEDVARAYEVNSTGVGFIAEACREYGAHLVHISTDYVFGDGFSAPIPVSATAIPPNVYGASKLAGEELLKSILPTASCIIRTSSVHGGCGQNFVHTMMNLFRAGKEVRVVDDQMMSPTWAGWLAEVLLYVGRRRKTGVYHCSCAGVISWCSFAEEILKQMKRLSPELEGLARATIIPVTAAEFPRPAKRASYSALDCSDLYAELGKLPVLTWQEGLACHLAELSQ